MSLKFNWNNWNNWNATAVDDLLPLLFYEASHGSQLLGRLAAEVREGEVRCVARAVERGVDCAVGLAMQIDTRAQIHDRIALLRSLLLLRGRLHSFEVVFAVALEHTINVLAHVHAPGLARDDLEVNAQMRVGEEVAEEAVVLVLFVGG